MATLLSVNEVVAALNQTTKELKEHVENARIATLENRDNVGSVFLPMIQTYRDCMKSFGSPKFSNVIEQCGKYHSSVEVVSATDELYEAQDMWCDLLKQLDKDAYINVNPLELGGNVKSLNLQFLDVLSNMPISMDEILRLEPHTHFVLLRHFA